MVQMNEGLDDFGAMAQGGLVCAGVPPTIVERRQRMLNFAISTYTPLLSRLRACKAHPDVQVRALLPGLGGRRCPAARILLTTTVDLLPQALMHKMHASGELRELALAGYRERLEAAAKSGAATGHVRAQAGPSRVRSAGAAAVGGGDDSSEQPGGDGAAEAVDGPSGTQAGARAGRAAIKQRGGSAGFRGITRTSGGRFVANVHVSLNKVWGGDVGAFACMSCVNSAGAHTIVPPPHASPRACRCAARCTRIGCRLAQRV